MSSPRRPRIGHRLLIGSVLMGYLMVWAQPAHAQVSLTFTVNTTTDTITPGACTTPSPGCSIREAIAEANAEPAGSTITIKVPAGYYHLTTTGMSLDPITNRITVSGAGPSTTKVDATGNSSRVFSVGSGAIVTLQGLTITGGTGNDTVTGSPGQGGGIYNNGTLTLFNDAVTNNTAFDGAGNGSGGGLFHAPNTLLTIGNTTFDKNVAGATVATGSVSASGGAIYIGRGTASVTSSKFTNNEAKANASNTGIALGGAIYDSGQSSFYDVTIANNSARGTTTGSGDGPTAFGGAVYGFVDTFVKVRITGNTAYARALVPPFGGGVFFTDGGAIISNSTVSITGPSVISGNTVQGDASGGAYATAYGGAIYGVSISLQSGVDFTANRALATATGAGSQAASEGGAIEDSVSLAMDTVTFRSNTARSIGTATGGQIRSDGGAIISGVSVGSGIAGGHVAFMQNVTSAEGNPGATANGGAVFNAGPFSLQYATFVGNTATTDGGAIYAFPSVSPQVSLNDSRVDHNTAGVNGGGIYNLTPLLLNHSPVVLNTVLTSGGCPNTVTPCT